MIRDYADPIFHAGFSDSLDRAHPLANEVVYCVNCKCMVHASYNENMAAWFETGIGAVCLLCFWRSYEVAFAALKKTPPDNAPDWDLLGIVVPE